MANGKKGGKTAPKKEAEKKAPEAQATETTAKKSNNLFLDRVNTKFIFDRGTGKDGKNYQAVSFACPSEKDPKRLGTILVKEGQVLDSTKKGKDGQTMPLEGYKNILLGTKGQHYTVSFNEKDAKGNFVTAKMTAEEIKKSFDDAKAAYKTSQKEAKAAEKGAEKGAEQDAPEVE